MSRHRFALRFLAGLVLLGGSAWAWGQGSESPRRPYSSLINVDALIDNYARLLARKYNLTAEQDAFTQQFLHERCNEFLSQHREQLFAVMDRMFDVRGGAEMGQQELVSWGRQAMPLFEQAKKLIVQGNQEWREILTEQQRQIHDQDLELMYDSFATSESQLQRIVAGEMTVEEFRQGPPGRPARQNRPAAAPTANQPVRSPFSSGQSATSATPPAPPNPAPTASPAQPQATAPPPQPAIVQRSPEEAATKLQQIRKDRGAGTAPSPPNPPTPGKPGNPAVPGRTPAPAQPAAAVTGPEFESQWELYVRQFIEKYQLDEEQSQRARSILKDCQEQARSYMAKRKVDLEELDRKVRDLTGSTDKLKEMQELNERRTKLLEPIGRIFERQLKPRLERLPSRAQRQAAEAAGPKAPGKPGEPPKPGARPTPPAQNPKQPVPPPPPQPVPQPPEPQPEDPGEPPVGEPVPE